jgi:hypothetical protein
VERSPTSFRLLSSLRAFGGLGALAWMAIVTPDMASLRVGWLLFSIAAFALFLAFPRHTRRYLDALLVPRAAVFVGVVAVVAFALSLAYVLGPMGNKPVSIDANVYLFEARMLTHGGFGANVPPPRLAYSARFLFEGPDGRLHGVFPPGYPLFLLPFVRFGLPLLAGPITAVLLVFGQNALGRALLRATARPAAPAATASPALSDRADRRELGHRFGLLVSLFAFERTLHTADLLSHAFVAALAAFAMAAALDLACGRGKLGDAAALGALAGWIFAARLLDGVLIGAVLATVIAVGLARRGLSVRHVAVALACALPFVGLLAAQQKAATGSWKVPTQSEYFVRSDWPPTCHRIGFGKDVGCTVEHPDSTEKNGGDGYDLGDAARVVRERGAALGRDLFGIGLFGLLAFWPLVRRPSPAAGAMVLMILAIVIGYGLFYFGNVQWYGGRHVLPAAPFLWVLAGHALASFARPDDAAVAGNAGDAGVDVDSARARRGRALAAALVLTMLFAGQRAWTDNTREIEARQRGRSDVRRSLVRHDIERGIFRSSDTPALVAALDPERDDARIHLVTDDHSGLLDVRRTYPDLPLILSLERDEIGTALGLAPPKPGLLVELERAWPSYERPEGLAASPKETEKLAEGAIPPGKISGGRALFLTHAAPGSRLRVPFDVARDGDYVLRLDGLAGPSYGRYAVDVDGVALPPYEGYAPKLEPKRGTESARAHLAAGRHTLTLRCEGKDEASRGYDAALDALVGTL